jgi:H+/gluconate symporter-like permease
MDDDAGFSLFTAIPRALVAALIAGIGYLVSLYALRPGQPAFDHVFVGALANYIALGMAVLLFGAIFWRLMTGGGVEEEISKLGDVDLD